MHIHTLDFCIKLERKEIYPPLPPTAKTEFNQRISDNMKNYILFPLSVFLIFANCSEKKDDSSKLAAIAVLASRSVSGSTVSGLTQSSTFSCSVSNPAFSTLASAGTTSNCAKSGCHNTASSQQGLDITSYTSVKAKAVSGDPAGSLIYQKITSGTMAVNSNSTIAQAVYCWIKGGLNP